MMFYIGKMMISVHMVSLCVRIFKEEFDEAKAEFANPQSQATVNEAVEHLKKLPLQVIN